MRKQVLDNHFHSKKSNSNGMSVLKLRVQFVVMHEICLQNFEEVQLVTCVRNKMVYCFETPNNVK